jgi:hypothetical protein
VRIYQAEKDAGIDFQMNKTGSSSAFVTTQVQVGDINKYFDGMSVADLIKTTSTVQSVEELLGQEQPDLALVVAILVSTGWNRNDDIFTPEEVWKARSSSLHKPMNDKHDAKKILGHIVQSRVLDKSGNEIVVAEGDSIPTEFDIEVAGVLYRAFPELSDRIDEIIAKAQTGEMFVSMECWFPDFGYGLIDPDTNEIKLIQRTEATAFLTKHLQIYGGSGQYQGYRIGRVLRDFIFGAQGFTDEPANPESVIKVAASKVAASRTFVNAELNEFSEGGVEDMNEDQIKELQEKFKETQTSLTNKEKEVVELQKAAEEFDTKAKDYDGQIAVLTTKVDELTASATEASEKMATVETAKDELQKQLDEATERVEKSEAKLDEICKNEAARERLSKLSEVKKIEDEDAALAELRDMTDETFELVLKYAGEVKSEEVEGSGESENKANATNTETDEKAEAALNNVEEEEGVDFNATENAAKSEDDLWLSTANALVGREEKDEGGE